RAGLLLLSRGLDDAECLIDGLVKFAVHGEGVALRVDGERASGKRGFGITGIGELFCNRNARRVHDFGFYFVPEAGGFERRYRGGAIRSELWFRDRDRVDVRFGQVGQVSDGGCARRPHDEFAARVDGAGARRDQLLRGKLVNVLHVGGEKDVEGRTVFDLLRELRRCAHAGDDVNAGFLFECRAEFRENVREIRRSGNVQFGLWCGRGQPCQHQSARDPKDCPHSNQVYRSDQSWPDNCFHRGMKKLILISMISGAAALFAQTSTTTRTDSTTVSRDHGKKTYNDTTTTTTNSNPVETTSNTTNTKTKTKKHHGRVVSKSTSTDSSSTTR